MKKSKIKRHELRNLKESYEYLDITESLTNVIVYIFVVLFYPFVWIYSKINNLIYDYIHKNMNDKDTND